MEFNQHDDSKSSSGEEMDQQEQANDDIGTGRSYECVFCKRGFTTAQALGGHMNIHRKDRARTTRPTSKPHEDYANPRFHHPPVQNHLPHYSSANFEAQMNYQMYFPASTSVARPPHVYTDDFRVQNPQILNPVRGDWPASLSLHLIPNHAEDTERNKGQSGSEEEEELDLELRLGHDP
ncbi:hypothetical protein L1049_004161 [Liquidambar formosana]|uniref:C2H2-type domain-containing protein n=1 Tax=Liquidambar formosana TaxID=63359 RepID=A0AAP0RNU7_LIQFO